MDQSKLNKEVEKVKPEMTPELAAHGGVMNADAPLVDQNKLSDPTIASVTPDPEQTGPAPIKDVHKLTNMVGPDGKKSKGKRNMVRVKALVNMSVSTALHLEVGQEYEVSEETRDQLMNDSRGPMVEEVKK